MQTDDRKEIAIGLFDRAKESADGLDRFMCLWMALTLVVHVNVSRSRNVMLNESEPDKVTDFFQQNRNQILAYLKEDKNWTELLSKKGIQYRSAVIDHPESYVRNKLGTLQSFYLNYTQNIRFFRPEWQRGDKYAAAEQKEFREDATLLVARYVALVFHCIRDNVFRGTKLPNDFFDKGLLFLVNPLLEDILLLTTNYLNKG